MMDRTVEIGEVIKALGRREAGSGMRDAGTDPVTPPLLRDAGSRPGPTHPASPISHPDVRGLPEPGPLTLDRLRALWPQIIADARASSQLLGALLATTEVAAVEGTTATIRPLEDNPVHAEGIERQREALARLVGRYVIGPVRVVFAGPEGTGGATPRARPVRLTEDAARADRLMRLRANDPGLSAAVDALDLELLE